MKRNWLTMVAAVASVAGMLLARSGRGQTPFDIGPGDRGATLKQPGFEAPAQKQSAPLPNLWNQTVAPYPAAGPQGQLPVQQTALPPSRQDINKDIEVTADVGPWMILVITYSGDQAPMQARKFVDVLRRQYKLPAYVYNYGAKEKQKEFERVQAEKKKQRDALEQAGMKNILPIRVRTMKIEEQTGVLIGGYRSRDEASRVLEQQIRKLTPPDPREVDVYVQYFDQDVSDPKSEGLGSKVNVNKDSIKLVNPFLFSAFPVRNPCVTEAPADESKAEIEFLRTINSAESLSVFNCKKKMTLAIKEYKTGAVLQDDQKLTKAFLNQRAGRQDVAGQNAHNLAEGLRKAGLTDAYVLHVRYGSWVTVGAFDGPQDPNLPGMLSFLEGYLRSEQLRPLDLLPRPIPIQVPH
jgi:hypothetical protein